MSPGLAEIHAEVENWREIRGLQLEGRAREIVGASERRRAQDLYLERYPFAKPLLVRLAGVRWYELEPERVYSIDNARGLGDRREIVLGGGGA